MREDRGEQLDDAVIETALGYLRGDAFRLAHLEGLLAPLPRAKGADEEILVGWPRPLPPLLRAAVGRSAELAGEDTFGLLRPIARERGAFRLGASPETLLVFSEAGGVPGALWSTDVATLGEPDPRVAWRSGAVTVEVPLSTWVQVHAVETVLLRRIDLARTKLADAQRARVMAAVTSVLGASSGEREPDVPWLVRLRDR
jgi:hypothetical protein